MEPKSPEKRSISPVPGDLVADGTAKIRQLHQLCGHLDDVPGSDPAKRIHEVVDAACPLLECAYACYHRHDNSLAYLSSSPDYFVPPDLPFPESYPGPLPRDIAGRTDSEASVFGDLMRTLYPQTDPLVRRLALKACIGIPIRLKGQVVGVLCAMDTRQRQFSDNDTAIVGILSHILVSLEEQYQNTKDDEAQDQDKTAEQQRLSMRLHQAQKMEAIATLAGGIAHQFNNALAVILGNLEMIQLEGLSDPMLLRFIDPINQASQKMVHLTSQLLAYARGGKFQAQMVASKRFVRETLSLVNHSIAPYVELQMDLDESTDFIEVDTTQMQMLLAAILSNASEAIEKKGIVRLALKNVDVTPQEAQRYQASMSPGRYVLLQVSDTGKGMDKKTLSRVFEPFFTTKFQGRGLGMAAVYGIVKMHAGFIYVDSQPNQGTTVSIFLPGIQRIENATSATPTSLSSRSGTALIVEDEKLVMEISRAIVQKLGYQVLEAKTGQEALEVARTYNGKIDFALLDVILPDMAGNQIYPQLIKARPDLKVIVCSGFSLDGPAREILNHGAERFLSKPFSMAALASTLDEILAPAAS